MKLHILILSALLIAAGGGACANSSTEGEGSNSNSNRPARSTSPSPNKEETPHVDKEKEARVLQKIQEFISTNYAGWTLKGTENLGKSPLDLHIVKGTEEKVIKVNYKEFNDLNGQPYIVISKVSQNDLSEQNLDDKQSKPSPSDAEQRGEKNAAPNN